MPEFAAAGALDDTILQAIAEGPTQGFPGAVVLVASGGRVVHHRAFGHAQTHDGRKRLETPRPATVDTVFDLASISKVLGTTAALMALHDDRGLDLDAPVVGLLPGLAHSPVRSATVRQLLTHRSGAWEWQPTYFHAHRPSEALAFAASLPLRYPMGACRRYSDIGFMLLGAVVEEVSGQPLERYLQSRVYAPLGITSTGYNPPATAQLHVAATSLGDAHERRMVLTGQPYPIRDGSDGAGFPDWRHQTLVAQVNDGNAWHAWKGVAGHAGLFGTARDVAVFAQAISNGGAYGDSRVFSRQTVGTFLAPQADAGQALGFWGDRLVAAGATGGFGHSGFTGVNFLLDPARSLVVVLLTNRLHVPGEPKDIAPVWQTVLRHSLASLTDRGPQTSS